MAAEQEILFLRNDLVIMRVLEASARGDNLTVLREQLEQTRERVTLLEDQLDSRAEAA
jgi:Tfp pilus assembly protein PilO